jgi:hypothetical protein
MIMGVVDTDNNGDEMYAAENGFKMQREYGLTPNGNPLSGRWVLRNEKGEFIDFDQYRHDLMEHNNFQPDY